MGEIDQGETFPFSFTVTGDSGLSCEISLLRYPGDTPAFQRVINADATGLIFKGVLTADETSALEVPVNRNSTTWFIHGRLTDIDEDIREPVAFKLFKRWVSQ